MRHFDWTVVRNDRLLSIIIDTQYPGMKKTQNNNIGLFIWLSICVLSFFGFNFLSPVANPVMMEEICDNATDDDNDGLIDLNDPDCVCEVIEPTSLIPNPSFEEMDCCPQDRSQLYCASGWIQASEPTTDFLHTCGWMGWDDFPPPLPFPDGEGCMGFRDGRVRQNTEPERNWKEYAGACLLSPLQAGTLYRFEFYVGFVNTVSSPPINITFFGTTNCNNLPFGDNNIDFGCPTNGPGWVELGHVLVSGGVGDKWVQTAIEVTPSETINTIAIGPPCAPIESPESSFYFFDNLILADTESFEFRINEVGHPCEENFLLEVPVNSDYSYQWYKDGIALIDETTPVLTQMYGEGRYEVRILDDDDCRISIPYIFEIPVYSHQLNISICEFESFNFGDLELNESGAFIDTFKNSNNCDSIVYLNLEVLPVLSESISVKIFEGEQYDIGEQSFSEQGDHIANLESSFQCDSLVFLNLTYYNVFIPNVFSPNGDGINDLFYAFGPLGEIETQEILIYDRWGAQIYSGDQWDGRSAEAYVNPGVYIYVAKLTMDDGIERQFSGSVTVLR